MHWHILGAGAIGCLWAGFLSRAGHRVSLILRNPAAVEQWPTSGGLSVTEEDHTQAFACRLETLDAETPIEHLLVATKAYDTLSAIEAIQARLLPGAEVVLLQNGMGQQQAVTEQLTEAHIWAATTTAGAWLESRHQLHCVSRGETHMGALTPNAPELPSGWAELDIALHPCADIRPHLWRKLAINCAINPLTALYDCRNGELIDKGPRQQQMQAVCTEVEAVARAAGIRLFDCSLIERACAVATATGNNFSSMLQDIRHGRRSEIEQITGFLCRQADELAIEVPINRSLLHAIRALNHKD